MQPIYDNFIGPFIFFTLIISIPAAFILPKTKLSKHFKISQGYFLITNICGIIAGALGIAAIFYFTPEITKEYLWKIIITPYVLMQIYTLAVMSAKNTIKIYDEKQDLNMTSAAALTFVAMTLVMGFLISPLAEKNGLKIELIFPLFINSAIFIYSAITLVLFKKA